MIELLKVIIIGIVEGITEWLPISSTGHMILVDEFIQLQASDAFKKMFFVVIQLGAIMAVVVLYWDKLFPFSFKKGFKIDSDIMSMWFKIVVASLPAAIVGILFDDIIDKFMGVQVVPIMLILFGIFFIVVENRHAGQTPRINTLSEITYQTALIIGLFQLIAAVFPGTSRSGATIVGALMIGVSRFVAAEFTFFMAVPVMFGASLLKLISFGFNFTSQEALYLIVGMIVAFVVSIITIKFLMGYIKNNDFKAFGWYRIVLGLLVIIVLYLKK
ncbi:undecaprenyl-diphosphate phosphatase [Erysipelothrix urinaevulpis]|uniref:undecaprenyl-diphosphate phosphatase n=1 Tax=Erysipelothrix urinaevulpis TaxID=2683717 RepID=UPI001356E205|nr:undecaprenyl-diphosphate phosphatase [Erysipelothrix urinaevulpis]